MDLSQGICKHKTPQKLYTTYKKSHQSSDAPIVVKIRGGLAKKLSSTRYTGVLGWCAGARSPFRTRLKEFRFDILYVTF